MPRKVFGPEILARAREESMMVAQSELRYQPARYRTLFYLPEMFLLEMSVTSEIAFLKVRPGSDRWTDRAKAKSETVPRLVHFKQIVRDVRGSKYIDEALTASFRKT